MKVRHFLKLNLLAIFIIAELTVIHAQEGMKVSNSNADIQPLPKGVSVYQLDNGMQVLLIENPALPMVGVNAAVKVGSAYETFSTSGMCHMLEHLLFNGTTSRSQKQLYDDVDLIGGYNNAHTDLYYTDFMMVTPAQNILQGMQIQADMLFNSTLPQDKFEKEKGIVLEEISKSLADPTEQMERNTISVLYQGHSLSLPTLGTYSTLKSLSRDNVYNFYKDNYVPNNMILSVIGNFNTGEILEQIKKIYGEVSPGMVKRDVTPGWSTGFQIPDYSFLNEDLTYYRFYDGKKVVLQLFYELPKHESPKYSELLNLILDKNKDTIQEELKAKFPSIVNSVNISSRLTPVKNFLEADIVLDTIADYNSIANYASNKIAEISFRLKDETVQFEAAKARTEFLRNIEKPHMFGIYNSNDLVINGVEAVLASYYSEEYYKAAAELAGLQVTGRPLIIIQSP
ncbi:MAG TPA: pitrilysin family protein, partial [Ignavibacteriaceae bacterium]